MDRKTAVRLIKATDSDNKLGIVLFEDGVFASDLQPCQRKYLESRKKQIFPPTVGMTSFPIDDYFCKVVNKSCSVLPHRVFSGLTALKLCKECPNRGEGYEIVLKKLADRYVQAERKGGCIK